MFSSGYPPLHPPSFYCFSGCQHWNCLRYQLFLLGGELGDDPPSCRCWAGEPRAARVLSRVHSLDIGNWAGLGGKEENIMSKWGFYEQAKMFSFHEQKLKKTHSWDSIWFNRKIENWKWGRKKITWDSIRGMDGLDDISGKSRNHLRGQSARAWHSRWGEAGTSSGWLGPDMAWPIHPWLAQRFPETVPLLSSIQIFFLTLWLFIIAMV